MRILHLVFHTSVMVLVVTSRPDIMDFKE